MQDDPNPIMAVGIKPNTFWLFAFWVWLLVLAALELFAGVPLVSATDQLDVGLAVASGVIIYCWFSADASQRRYSASLPLRVGVLLLAAIAVPYYVLRANGLRRALMAYAKFTLFLTCYFAVLALVMLLIELAHYFGFPHN